MSLALESPMEDTRMTEYPAHPVETTDTAATSTSGVVIAGPAGFDLLNVIGRGGMGVVWRARDRALEREVAVKVLVDTYAPNSSAARRFVDEARITGQLQHPGIPAVYQVGTFTDGRPFLAMKLIKGQTLDVRLKAGAAVDTLAVFAAVSQAVGYAHAHGVIHRDLKPHNVMVGAFSEIQVMDWGLAKVLADGGRERPGSDPEATAAATVIRSERDSDTPFTQYGSVLGTPAYMAPEQAAGELDKIGPRTDVFGLGAILCNLLTGKPPYDGTDAESVRLAAVRGQTTAALVRLDGCAADPEVVALCKRCLAFEPAARPATAEAVAAEVVALRRAADERVRQAERDKLAAEVRGAEHSKRRRVVQRAAVAVAAVLLLGLVGTGLGLWRADAARQDANEKRIAAETAQANEANQARIAKEETALANAVKVFLQFDVLQLADPATQQREGAALPYDADVRLRDVVLRAAERIDGKFRDRPLVEAEIRHTLGYTLRGMGRPDLAAKQLERAAELRRACLGPDHPDTLGSMANLASSYFALGRHADALRLFQETLALQKARLGPDHPDTLTGMNNLALSYAALGRHADALELCEEALALRKARLGPNHPATLGSMNNLAESYAALGRQDDALNLREETLALRTAKLGPDHPDTLASMSNLANSYAAVGRYNDALRLREKTLALRAARLGPDHPDTLQSKANLANSYFGLGRQAYALKLREETLALMKARLGPDHPDTLGLQTNLAIGYRSVGREADALPLLEDSFRRKLAVLPANHQFLSTAAHQLSNCYWALDRGADATATADRYLRHVEGKEAVQSAWITSMLGLRNRHLVKTGDAVGCRATAELWEKRSPKAAVELYYAARLRAVAAGVQARAKGGDSARLAKEDADKAMAWLQMAVAAGFKDRGHIERDNELDFLRGREDFKSLLSSLPLPAPAPPAK